MLLNKTETTYFGFDTDSNNSNVRGVPHAVSAPQQAYGQTTQNPTNEPNDAAEEDAVNAKKESEEAADAKAPKTNSGGQEKSTSSSSKAPVRKIIDDSSTSFFVNSRTLMGCTDPLRRGVGAPHQCPLGVALVNTLQYTTTSTRRTSLLRVRGGRRYYEYDDVTTRILRVDEDVLVVSNYPHRKRERAGG